MSPKRTHYLLSLLFLASVTLQAQPSSEKDNIIITSKKESYEYKTGDNKNPVVVKSTAVFEFKCNQYRASLPFSEIYNDMVEMNKVSVSTRGVAPKYSSYNSDGIFYSDAKICYFYIPFSKKDETSEVRIQQTYLDPRYFTTVYFPEAQYTVEKEVEIIVPKWMDVELREINFTDNISRSKTFDAKRNADVYSYKAKNIPAIKREGSSPGPSFLYPHVMILNKSASVAGGKQTYFETLDNQYAWYRGLVKEVEVNESLLKETALQLTKNSASDIDKIKTIFEWVQDNIRYIAFEDGIAGFKPAAPQDVLSKKYGDCKGMGELTKELLKALGFDARLAWLGTNHIAYDYSTPSMAVDNHVICALLYNDRIYYLDATEKYIGFDEYAERIQDRQVLIENGDSYQLERIPLRTPNQNTETEKCNFDIKDGSLTGKVVKTYKGEGKEEFLAAVNSIKKDKLNDALIEYLRKENDQYQVIDLTHSSMNAMSKEVSLEYKTINKAGIQQYDKEYYIDLDFRKEFLNSLVDTAKREHSYMFSHKYHIVHEAELAIPSNIKVESLPEDLHIVRDTYRFDISYSQKAGKVLYRKEIMINNTLLPRKFFNQWNKDITQLKKVYLDQISLITK